MKTSLEPTDARAQLIHDAWIGDAVLTLYVREKILREDHILDGPKSVRMTSNHFLATIAEPTSVEAEVGRVYSRNGLAAAFAYIDHRILPTFEKQEANRLRKPRACLKRLHH